MINILKRFPAASYFVLAYVIAWGGILLSFWPKSFSIYQGESVLAQGLSGQMMIVWLAMLAGPSVAGLLTTWLVDGRDGLKKLLSRFLTWRVAFKWYAAALFIFPALLLIIFYSLSIISPVFLPSSALILGLVAGLIGGSIEELGWTGFALPKLQLKFNPLVAGIVLGVIHIFWHLLADLWGGVAVYKEYYVLHFLLWILCLTGFRLIVVWIYNKTQSLWLAQLTHASFTGSQLALSPTALSVEQGLVWYALFAAAIWVVAIVIIVRKPADWLQRR